MGRARKGRSARLALRLDPHHAAWLDAEAARTGFAINAVVEAMVDHCALLGGVPSLATLDRRLARLADEDAG